MPPSGGARVSLLQKEPAASSLAHQILHRQSDSGPQVPANTPSNASQPTGVCLTGAAGAALSPHSSLPSKRRYKAARQQQEEPRAAGIMHGSFLG